MDGSLGNIRLPSGAEKSTRNKSPRQVRRALDLLTTTVYCLYYDCRVVVLFHQPVEGKNDDLFMERKWFL